MNNYDVIIVGGGGSGLAAGVSAAEHGASVLVLEKLPELGGSTGIAVGSYTANRTAWQRNAGVQDSLEEHAVDAGKFAPPEIEARNNAELRRWFLSLGAETLDWLASMGLAFQGPNPEPPNTKPRMHNVVPGAKAYIAALQSRLLRLGGQAQTGAEVTELLVENGRVTGVVASVNNQPVTFHARKGVILAAGDYTNSPEIIARFKGERFREIEGINPHSTGSGHLLAEDAGAKLVNMDVTYGPEIRFIAPPGRTFQQLLPVHGPLARLMGVVAPRLPAVVMNALIRRLLVTWQHPENALFDDGAILVNSRGERFCVETAPLEREIAIANQPGKIAHILMDARLVKRYSSWPHFISTAPKIAYAYANDYLRLRPDVAVQGSSLEAVAARRDLPPQALKKSVEQANQGRHNSSLALLGPGPWLLLGPAKAYFTTTEGGVVINRNFQALDENGEPIPGLYAAGQNGLSGMILWGHGLHIAWAITSGRLAGKQVALLPGLAE